MSAVIVRNADVSDAPELCRLIRELAEYEKMSDVVIKAQVVSRMHCCIYHEAFKDDEYLVEDLNATNGTYLNGERLGNHERKKLSDGDVLKIAAISFKVEIS